MHMKSLCMWSIRSLRRDARWVRIDAAFVGVRQNLSSWFLQILIRMGRRLILAVQIPESESMRYGSHRIEILLLLASHNASLVLQKYGSHYYSIDLFIDCLMIKLHTSGVIQVNLVFNRQKLEFIWEISINWGINLVESLAWLANFLFNSFYNIMI